jgi:DNA-binding MarR family transcriptional regulator
VRNHVEQTVLREKNLTWTGFVVLREVWTARQLETRHAAEQAGIAKATLTGVVDTLVRRGLVRRVRHPADGRLVLLEMTRSGQRLVRDLLPAAREEEAFALAYLDEEQIADITDVLRRLISHLDHEAARDRRPS